jgi:hypothetical protein
VVVAVAVIPAAAYAWELSRGTENPEETWGLDHYPVQGAFAIALVLVAGLAAYATGQRLASRWLPALTVGFSAAWFGVQSMVWPERLGSAGTVWGLLVVVWGVALVGVVGIEGRRSVERSPVEVAVAGS